MGKGNGNMANRNSKMHVPKALAIPSPNNVLPCGYDILVIFLADTSCHCAYVLKSPCKH